MRLRTATSLMSLLGDLALGFLAYEVVTPADRLEAGSLVVELPAHDGVLDIANRLQRADAIRSRAGFVLLTMARGSSRSLKAGEYELERGATTLDVLTLIESGRVKQHAILHPEGATVTELARVLEADRLTTARDVARLSTDAAFLKTLSIDGPSLEGYLFPDTYQLVRGMTPEEILTRMVRRMRSKLGAAIDEHRHFFSYTIEQHNAAVARYRLARAR